jgi:predicted RNase H-like HicB family nuclease
MTSPQRLTAIIEREDDGFVALCPELDIASQGESIEEAREPCRSLGAVFR